MTRFLKSLGRGGGASLLRDCGDGGGQFSSARRWGAARLSCPKGMGTSTAHSSALREHQMTDGRGGGSKGNLLTGVIDIIEPFFNVRAYGSFVFIVPYIIQGLETINMDGRCFFI